MLIFEDLKRFSHPLIFKNNDVVETDGKDGHSLRTADAFPVVDSLPPKNSVCEPERQNDFGGREATTGNASAVRRLGWTRVETYKVGLTFTNGKNR